MSKAIQIRKVSDALHRKLKARAAMEGMSLSDYLLAEIRRTADRPTRRELLDRLAHPTRAALQPSPADLVRRERDAR